MKKKGFTLVELLAVIVILAVICLIAVPIILNVISTAKESAFLDSSYGILKSAEYYATNLYGGQSGNVNNLIRIRFPDDEDILKVKGKEPDAGSLYIKGNKMALSLWDDSLKRCAVKSYNDEKITLSDKSTTKEQCSSGELIQSDTQAPTIKLLADFNSGIKVLEVTINVTDEESGVSIIKYASGSKTNSYFENDGIEIENNSTIQITENGIYTFYSKDVAGNAQTYCVTVNNIVDKYIEIIRNPDETLASKIDIDIDYKTAKSKKYKVGKQATWKDYDGNFSVTSEEVLESNLQNEDNTLTICVQGIFDNDIVEEWCDDISNLDLDLPEAPIISVNGTLILTKNGMKNGIVSITYDDRDDIDNYYSVDGINWNLYSTSFSIASDKVYAKSVKKVSNLTISSEKDISNTEVVLGAGAYDNDDTTYGMIKTYPSSFTFDIIISEEVRNRNLRIYAKSEYYSSSGSGVDFEFYDQSGNVVGDSIHLQNKTDSGYGDEIDDILRIPSTAEKLTISYGTYQGPLYIYEMQLSNKPVINCLDKKTTLTLNNGIVASDSISIDFPEFVNRYYKVDSGEWTLYNDENLKLISGQTLTAKSVDSDGVETYSTYTIAPVEIFTKEAYDGDTSTYITIKTYPNAASYDIFLDSNVLGKNLNLNMKNQYSSSMGEGIYFKFYDDAENEVGDSIYMKNSGTTYNDSIAIPATAKKFVISYSTYQGPLNIYEIGVN